MSAINSIGNIYFVYQFIKKLVTPFSETEAFKLGIIDEKGKVLKKRSTLTKIAEREAYTLSDTLIFNLKKILAKVPGGSTKFATFAAALFLIKEHTGMTDKDLEAALDKLDIKVDENIIQEKTIYTTDFEELKPGTYILNKEVCHEVTGDPIFLKGTKVRVEDFTNPVDKVLNINIFEAKHIATGQKIYISEYDIER